MSIKNQSFESTVQKTTKPDLTDSRPVGENITNKKPIKFKKKINKKIIRAIVTILALGSVIAALVCAFVFK